MNFSFPTADSNCLNCCRAAFVLDCTSSASGMEEEEEEEEEEEGEEEEEEEEVTVDICG